MEMLNSHDVEGYTPKSLMADELKSYGVTIEAEIINTVINCAAWMKKKIPAIPSSRIVFSFEFVEVVFILFNLCYISAIFSQISFFDYLFLISFSVIISEIESIFEIHFAQHSDFHYN
jgi:hypothetical protein